MPVHKLQQKKRKPFQQRPTQTFKTAPVQVSRTPSDSLDSLTNGTSHASVSSKTSFDSITSKARKSSHINNSKRFNEVFDSDDEVMPNFGPDPSLDQQGLLKKPFELNKLFNKDESDFTQEV